MALNMVLKDGCNDDRISNLPDGILCHILSLLPTKYSVRTRVLSKRWKHLFTFVPILDFEYTPPRSSYITSNSTESNTRRRISSKKFVDFVNSVFLAYKVSKIKKFRLIHKDVPLNEHCDIVSWISIAMCRRVLELDIAVSLRWFQTLPRHVFSSETLTSLKIDGSFSILLPDSVSLPCLRTCHLFHVWLSGDSAQKLFKSCPVLEDLMLINCDMKDVQSLDISGVALERFVIHEVGRGYQLVLNSPKLLSFEYMGHERSGVSKGDFLRLLVNKVCHVQSLSICAFMVQAFQYSGNLLPKFPNLTSLMIGLTPTLGLGLLLNFLDKSPRLELFVIVKEFRGNQNNVIEENTILLPENVPACVSKHIKKIEFRHFSKLEYDFKLVEYFLKNASVLDKMKIQTRINCKEKLEIRTRVLAFPRCLAACDIVFESVDEQEV